MLGPQRFRQQRIVEQIDHPQAEVVASAPVSVGLAEFVGAQRCAGYGRSRRAVCAENFEFKGGRGSHNGNSLSPGCWKITAFSNDSPKAGRSSIGLGVY